MTKASGSVVKIQPAHAEELAAIARTVDRYKADQAALRRAMENAGIITKSGQLSKEYQSS